MNVRLASTAADRVRRCAARRITRDLALSHYENFTVVSLTLPRRLRQDFFNIYAFCRHADDLADELASREASLAGLDRFRTDLRRAYEGTPSHPILLALRETISRYDIPIGPFLALIDAFEQDQRVSRYETYEQLLDYCRRSANPVGHLVLYLCGYRDARRQELSDCTCTALQLANFWQDVVSDLRRGRIYLPHEDLRRFRVTEADLHAGVATSAFTDLMRFEVGRADELFGSGERLLPLIDRHLRVQISLYGRGGRAILGRIRAVGYNVLSQRPTIGRWAKLLLLSRALLSV